MQTTELGNYVIGRPLGHGVSGEVFEGYIKNNPTQQVAIKQFYHILLAQETPQNPIVQQFVKEGQFLEFLNQIKGTQRYSPDFQHLNQLLQQSFYFQRQIQMLQLTKLFLFSHSRIRQEWQDFIYKQGDLCDFLCENTWLPEAIAACYNEQAARAVKVMHDFNVAHMDIKPENMLLDENFILKLADFGSLIFDNTQSNQNCGTKGYKAPEIHRGEQYFPKPADIFSLGVTFFAIRSSVHPFQDTQPDINLEIYNNLISNPEKFWQQVVEFSEKENKNKIIFELEFKDLIERMLHYVPEKRPSIDQVLAHPYFTKYQKVKQQDLTQFMINQYLRKTTFTPIILLNKGVGPEKPEIKSKFQLIAEQISLNTFEFQVINKFEKIDYKQKLITFIRVNLYSRIDSLKFSDIPTELENLKLHQLITYSTLRVGTILEEKDDKFYWSLIDIQGDKMQLAKFKKNIRQTIKLIIDENQIQ